MKKILLVLGIGVALSACSSGSPVDEEAVKTESWTQNHLYDEAKAELNSHNYKRAVKLYEILQARFPTNTHIQQSFLESAYSSFKDENTDQALAKLGEFYRLYPTSNQIDYALYLNGLIDLGLDADKLDKLSITDWSRMDSSKIRQAFSSFERLVNRYPNSQYADASHRYMNMIYQSLSAQEIHIASFYMKKNAYLAALNRAQNVLRDYPNSVYTEEALAILMAVHKKMGNQTLYDEQYAQLQQRFPQSRYLKEAWQPTDKPWWSFWK